MTPPITALGSRYGIQGALGRSVKRAAGGYTNWWDLDGAITSCVAAYQASGAASYVASLTDLSGNNNHATEGNAPGWNAVNGWIFNGTDDYLKTGVLSNPTYTMIVKFTDVSNNAILIGARKSATVSDYYIVPNTTSNQVAYRFGNTGVALAVKAPALLSGILAIAGNVGFRNGTPELTMGGTFAANYYDIYIGALNQANAAAGWIAACVQSVAIYNATLTNAEVLAVTNALRPSYIDSVLTINKIGDRVAVLDDTRHYAFPSLCKLSNGNLLAVYRDGVSHTGDKATIKSIISTDNGATWGSIATVYSDATYDVRDPNIALLANGRLIVSFFKYDQSAYAGFVDNVYVIYSDDNGATWETPVQLTSCSFTLYGQVSSPVVQLANGDLLLPTFGKDTGDTYASARLQKSTDAGATWTELATIQESGTRNHYEPNVVLLNNGNLLCVVRSDAPTPASGIFYKTVSTDSGATWSTESAIFEATGSPRMLVHTNGVLLVYRENTTDSYHAVMRLANADGTEWSREYDLDTEEYEMTYASAVEFINGDIGIIYGVEDNAQNNGNLYFQ